MKISRKKLAEVIKKLSEAHASPGNEDEVRQIIKNELKDICSFEVDKLGNLIARRKAKKTSGKAKKIMLAAHMDEISLIVKHIDNSGYIRFTTLGGFFDQTILNQEVIVHSSKGRVKGVIGSKPPHLMEEEERKKVIQVKNMFIDVGAKDKKSVEKLGIKVGDFITFNTTFKELANNYISGKAFDDRLGCAVMIEAMKSISESEHEIYAVGTVQEEVGLKGARTSAFKINPDFAIALDVAPAGDFPGVDEKDARIKTNAGPVITIVDGKGRGIITQKEVREGLVKAAEKNKIPYQLEVGEGGTTDATIIQLTREGVFAGVVSVPTRYIHTPVEVCSIKDVENAIKLVVSYISML